MPIDGAGLHLAAHARSTPERPALIVVPGDTVRTFGQLEAASVRVARLLRERGLRVGDHLAVLVDNEPAFFDVVWAAMRTGLFVTPINWHLSAREAGCIVGDCDAAALVASARLAGVVAGMDPGDLARVSTRLSIGGDIAGFERLDDLLDDLLDDAEAGEVPDEHDGAWMFYSSGTTGRPKGILPAMSPGPLGAPSFLTRMLGGLFGFDADTVYLSPAPLYHAAPAGWTNGPSAWVGRWWSWSTSTRWSCSPPSNATASPMCSWCPPT